MPQAVLAGTDCHWITKGAGANPALLLHCGLGSARMWRPLTGHLETTYLMRALDLPGHGQTGPWDQTQEYQTQCTNVARALVDGQRVDIIGHSFGATVALRLAAEHPDAVRNLILVEPVFFAAAKLVNPQAFEDYLAAARPFAEAFAAGNLEEATRRFNHIWGDGTSLGGLSDLRKTYLVDRIRLILATEPALIHDTAGLLQNDRLNTLHHPTWLIEGTQSPDIVGVIHKGLQSAMPNTTRHIIDGAGHMSPVTHTGDVAMAISEFIGRVSRE